MDTLNIRNKNLYLNDVKLEKILKGKQTPIYIYSVDQIKKNIKEIQTSFKKAQPLICFAIKANSNINILKVDYQEILYLKNPLNF